MAKTATGNHARQVIRKMVQVGGLEPRDCGGLSTLKTAALIAVLSRIVGVGIETQAPGLQKTRHLLFLLLALQRSHHSGKILCCVILVAAPLDGDADGVTLWVGDIGAGGWGMRPR